MDSFTLSLILKPFVLFAALAFLLAVRKGVQRFMPAGKLKDLLLREV
jgi:hypothetical protein